MRNAVLILSCAVVTFACANGQMSLLDEELQVYRYDQEKYRGMDLDNLYREELARSEELTAKILALREEIGRKKQELAELTRQLAELEAARKAAAAQLATPPAAQPPAAGGAAEAPTPR